MSAIVQKAGPFTRRNFLRALAASVVAAGCPLPIGFPDPAGSGWTTRRALKVSWIESPDGPSTIQMVWANEPATAWMAVA